MRNMTMDTRIQFRLDSELKTMALNKGLNLSEVSRNAIRAAVYEEETYEHD